MNFITKFDRYTDENKGKLARTSLVIYLLIEAAAVTVSQYYIVDDAGNITIPERFENIAFWTEIFKMVYLTWLELLFGSIFITTWKKQLYDGFQLHDIPPMFVSAFMMLLTTGTIFVIMAIGTGYIDITFDVLNKPVQSKHLTTFILIITSLIVNIMVVVLRDKDDLDRSLEIKKQRVAEAVKKATEPKEEKKGEKSKEEKKSDPPADSKDKDPKDEEDEEDLLKEKWMNDPDPKYVLPLIQRMGSLSDKSIDYDATRVKAITQEETEKVFDFISAEDKFEDQMTRAFVAFELMQIFKSTDHVRKYPELAAEWGK